MVFTRPENALSRANEFITVGKHQIALDTLSEVIKSRKHRAWTKIHQPIMEKYLELCVLLRKSDRAKDGLYQYKNICQTINVNSLEEVMMTYLKLAEQKTDEARKISHASLIDIEDLDTIQTPESLIKAAESGSAIQGQTEKDNSAAWLKFLWESYKQCLDILKNNNRVELQYKMVAQAALQFSLKYQRKIEFRKFCDMIRQHLQLAYKHALSMNFAVKLDNAESIKYLMDTRLNMFETAVKLDLWQEAFKSIEEIHEIMHQAKHQFTPAQFVNYYWKSSQVFWHAGYYACHAYALFRHFVVYRDQKRNATSEELTRFASRLVLAVLAVPSYQVQTQIDQSLENDPNISDKQKEVHHLLDIPIRPSRAKLLQDIEVLRITRHLPEDGKIKDLIKCMEVDFNPLQIKERIDGFINYLSTQTIDPKLIVYGKNIKEIARMRLLQQASQVYRNLTFYRLTELCPGNSDDAFISKQSVINRYLSQMYRANVIEVRIDDRSTCLTFASDLCAIPPECRDLGPTIQLYPQEIVRSQLSRVSTLVSSIVHSIHGQQLHEANKKSRMKVVVEFKNMESNTNLHTRSERIEKLKSIQEKVVCRRKENELLAARKIEQIRIDEERQKREAEIKKRDEERKTELKRLQNQQNMSFVLQSDFGKKALADKTPEELLNIDLKALQLKKQAEEMKAERERQNKLNSQSKKVDYFVRACHGEEMELLKSFAETYLENRKKHREAIEKEIIETALEERQLEVGTKERLIRMKTNKINFYEQLFKERKVNYDKAMQEYNDILCNERSRLMQIRREKRKKDRKLAWQKQKDEQIRKEREKKRKEEDEKQRILQEQRKKIEEEIYNKSRQNFESNKVINNPTSCSNAATIGPGSWKPNAAASAGMSTGSGRWNMKPSGFASVRQSPSSRQERRPMGFDRSMNDRPGIPKSNSEFDFANLGSWRKKN